MEKNKDDNFKYLAIGAGLLIFLFIIYYYFRPNKKNKLKDFKKEKLDLEEIKTSSEKERERNELKKKKLITTQKYIRYGVRFGAILTTLLINILYILYFQKEGNTINDILGYVFSCNAALFLIAYFIYYVHSGKYLPFEYLIELYTDKVENKIIKLFNKDTDNVEALLACNLSNIESVGPKIEEINEKIKELEKEIELEEKC